VTAQAETISRRWMKTVPNTHPAEVLLRSPCAARHQPESAGACRRSAAAAHRGTLDMAQIREYFVLFDREDLLDELNAEIDRSQA